MLLLLQLQVVDFSKSVIRVNFTLCKSFSLLIVYTVKMCAVKKIVEV